ncbi:FaeA/PapI family transcriptional regulator [Escherichia coli]|uniref:FaeA/PapI family transcriptional regulator n=1 Tax=Escherichia coli TaxID=562 RepID=UPI000BE5EEE1|nr:FaeA/PapI family transcriptional regulator [Escherichia coli]
MRNKNDYYQEIVCFMREHNASIAPVKTRAIADGCEISVYMALNYLRELHRLNIVEPNSCGKGKAIYWYLVD